MWGTAIRSSFYGGVLVLALLVDWGGAGEAQSSAALPQGAQPSAQSAVTAPGSAASEARVRRLDEVKPPTRDDVLRGSYGPYRANNDLLSYRLKLRVDPVAETVRGSNTVRFRMLADGRRMQMELSPALAIEHIRMGSRELKYTREEHTLWIDFPAVVRKGKVYEVEIGYAGRPVTTGRFGCFSFAKDPAGRPWITTACEGEGPSLWWPNKEQWRDEPQEGMEIDVAVPNGLMDVSNGRFEGSTDLQDGYTEWRWRVSYPINDYDVALNIGDYVHFAGPKHGATALDFFVLPENLEKARVQFAQVPEMLDAYEHYLGEYPFARDGFKLVEVPYAGMEHQSAVAYGNHFKNGYLERDWTGVGISPKFDFIIIHESGHEWFGNAITAADVCDMWIHEGWTTYLESLYVEYRWGKADALRYLNGLKAKVHNERPIITACGVNAEPPQDQYFKGALMLNTLRSVVDDDPKWFADVHDFYQQFKYRNIATQDLVAWWSERTGMDLAPFFGEYLRHAALPVLEWEMDPAGGAIRYRWHAEETGFAMPIEVGERAHWAKVTPVVGGWRTLPWSGTAESFKVATDLFYVGVRQVP